MTISLYDFSVAEFIRGLYTLEHILQKATEYAKEKNIDVAEIPKWKIIDDMNPLAFQIQTCSNTAKNTIARVLKADLPSWADDETTLEQLHARIQKTLDLLKEYDANAWAGKENAEVIMKVDGADRKFNGVSYVRDFALPNFWFHVATAYNILRKEGVSIGKRDFLFGNMKASSG
jgi:uncharacterized protein